MRIPPASLDDDALSHEPDFSFRDTQPADLDFTGRVPVISAAQANAKAELQKTTDTTPIPIPAETTTNQTPPSTVPTGENIQVTILREHRQPVAGLAVAAFVLSLAGIITPFFLLPFIVSILAIILGHIGARQAHKQQLAGRGLGIAAYVIGYLTILITAVLITALILLGIGAYNGIDGLLRNYNLQ